MTTNPTDMPEKPDSPMLRLIPTWFSIVMVVGTALLTGAMTWGTTTTSNQWRDAKISSLETESLAQRAFRVESMLKQQHIEDLIQVQQAVIDRQGATIDRIAEKVGVRER